MSANLIPEQYQRILEDAGHQADNGKWIIGDVAVELRSLFTVNVDGKEQLINYRTEEPMTVSEFHRSVGAWCGRSEGTVRDCERISANIPSRIRQRYDMLPRSHFRELIPHFETQKELAALCEDILAWGDDYGGRIISIEALRRKLKVDNGEPPAWIAWLKRLLRNAEKIRDHDETPPAVSKWAGDVVKGAPEE